MGEEVFLLTMCALVSGVVLLGVITGPIGRAIGRRIEGRSLAEADLQAIRDDVEAGTAEVADLRREVVELQERVDFAERVLAAPRDPSALHAGTSGGEG
ncbi:MAG: hypothetical protein AAB075_04545 [Gemmatimonadota bacterium]|mgnify:CR=1 FL=1